MNMARLETGLTRRQFFGRLRTLGFRKSRLQLTSIGITWWVPKDPKVRKATPRPDLIGVCITIPKHQHGSVIITGRSDLSGIWHWRDLEGSDAVTQLGLQSTLDVVICLLRGQIARVKEPV